ncbi:hypothetical protein ACFY97_18590 [Streptomyces klenkii]|uniref:hypothetical protein n=1 Tax=Streptomyces klenkii TaxID=1420899 RepID=UPI0036E64C07
MFFQTCHRHPSAGRFRAACPGCKQELFDLQAANEARAAAEKTAREALILSGTPADFRILSVITTDTTLIVATEQPDGPHPYAVDSFRLATIEETDPELIDYLRRQPGEWVLVESAGSYGPEFIDRMIGEAKDYLIELGLLPAPIVHSDDFWDHAEDCWPCLNAEDSTVVGGSHCPAGAALLNPPLAA